MTFPRNSWLFQQDDAGPHSARVTAAGLHRHELRSDGERALDGPACSPDPSPIENVRLIMNRGIRQRRPRTVEQLKSCMHQEWAKIPLAKLQRLISSVPK